MFKTERANGVRPPQIGFLTETAPSQISCVAQIASILRGLPAKVKHFPKPSANGIIRNQPMTIDKSAPNQKLSVPKLTRQAATAPFTPELMAVDPVLWGSFWHFDVIAPGSRLPAPELALLRAVRLDQTWPQTILPAEFLTDLHAAITHPQAGVWTVTLGQTPCAVFAAPGPAGVTVVWYGRATGCLHAGYRMAPVTGHFAGLTQQRAPGFHLPAEAVRPPGWLAESVAQRPANSLAARLDAAILRWRLYATG